MDSGMKNEGGHHFSYTRAMQGAFERRGVQVDVLANRHMDRNLAEASGYHGAFSFGTHDYPPGVGWWRDLVYLYAQSEIYAAELQQTLGRLGAAKYGLVFCHTIGDFELVGWKRYVERCGLPGHLVILERLTPRFRSASRLKTSVHPYWRLKPRYLRALRARLRERFVLATDSERLTEDYGWIYRHRIVTLPIPISDEILAPSYEAGARSQRLQTRFGLKPQDGLLIGYMGDARAAKGFMLLPAVVRRILSEPASGAHFVVHCPQAAGGHDCPGGAPGMEQLAVVAEEFGERVKLIPERLSVGDYTDLFRSLDVVLLPYSDRNFVEGTSGVFAEALALAKPVVVPRGSWMAQEVRKSGGGVEFEQNDVDDLAERTFEVVRDYGEYAVRAEAFRSAWVACHNPDNVAEILLRESRSSW